MGETEYGKGYTRELDEGRIEYGPKPHHPFEDIPDQNPDDFNRYGGYFDTDDPRPYGGRYSYADHGSEETGYGREAQDSDKGADENSDEKTSEKSEPPKTSQNSGDSDNRVNKSPQK